MKIDLHCHTKATKKGDSPKRNISPNKLKTIINSNGVKIIGVTNHNEFDYEQYKSFIKEAKDDFLIWPGVELDVKGISRNGHVIIINNPNTVDKFDEELKKLISTIKPDNLVCELDDLMELVNKLDCIVIAHYWKSKSLDEDSINFINDKIKEKSRFFWEPSQYKSMGILINHDIYSLIGSDVQDWDEYSKHDLPNIKLKVDSFEQFVLLAKKNPQIVDTLYQSQNKYLIDVGYKEKEMIEFYDDINIIFGTKGTGKSFLLGKAKEFFHRKGKSISYYDPIDNKDKLLDKLKVSESERKLELYGLSNCAREILDVSNWNERSVTQCRDYLNYILSKNGNANKDRMKILDITEISGTDNKKLMKLKTNMSKVLTILEINKDIELSNYIMQDEIEFIESLYKSVYKKIQNEFIDIWDNNLSIELSNKTVNIYKKLVEANTNLKTLPSTTGLSNYIKNRLKLENDIKSIMEIFNKNFDVEEKKLGVLEENKKLYIKKIVKMYDRNSKTGLFKKKVTDLRNVYNYLKYIEENIYEMNVGTTIADLKDILNESRVYSLDDFLGIKKIFTVDDKEYMPSTGEQTMIVLDEALEDSFDVYILDEPEKSLGNSYVNDVLVPQIIKLSKMKKTILIATHNANIAVRTFPLRSILKEYSNSDYKTYVGNPFSNELINIKDAKYIKDWKSESIKILEGGRFAFDERGEIYGNN
ncbi:MAG: hypothetical protein HFI09_02670 [Bacilli bacterium]|nr:hypothetical protein [Bacilli bacterium]